MSDNKITIRASTATDNGGYTYNQDRATIIETPTHTTCAVFDGHGTYGEEIAMWCVDKLRELLTADPATPLDTKLFKTLHSNIREKLVAHVAAKSLTGLNVYETLEGIYMTGTNKPVRGGTTATILRIDHTTGAITCASVGDSEARVFDADAEGTGLCGDHSTTNPAEYARVLAFCVENGRRLPRFSYDTQNDTLSRERRCPFVADATAPSGWAPNPAGGFFCCDIRGNYGAYFHTPTENEALAMTRALGDFNMERYGASHEPHVVTESPPVTAKTRAVVWASDGLWDLVPPRDVGALVHRADLVGNPAAASAALLELAKERTRAAFGGALGDNITVGVTYMTYPPPPAPAPAPTAETPEEALDIAFLLSGPFRRPSLFVDMPSPIPVVEEDYPAIRILDDMNSAMLAALTSGVLGALPGATEAILSGPPRVDPSTPEVRWMRAGSPAEREAILATLEADHPLHCDLHRDQILPGPGLRRSRNTARSYGMYAPSCSGCRIGAEEEAADTADDAELKACKEWLYMRINDLADAAIAGIPTADRRAEVESGIIRLEDCNAWSSFGDPAVIRDANAALAADEAAADIRRAMTIIDHAKEILRTATGRLYTAPRGTAYADYKTAIAFLEANP